MFTLLQKRKKKIWNPYVVVVTGDTFSVKFLGTLRAEGSVSSTRVPSALSSFLPRWRGNDSRCAPGALPSPQLSLLPAALSDSTRCCKTHSPLELPSPTARKGVQTPACLRVGYLFASLPGFTEGKVPRETLSVPCNAKQKLSLSF